MSRTVLTDAETGGLGAIVLLHPPGTFAPSPATRVTLQAVARVGSDLAGHGLDWGCGVGVLSIAAARLPSVEAVVGLDLSPTNVAAARRNADLNEVSDRTHFVVADSFRPVSPEGKATLRSHAEPADFLIANPPPSVEHDGFDFRRRILREGAPMLRSGAVVLVQALSAYGQARVVALQQAEYRYEGVALRTELVPLDFGREQIRRQLATYLQAETQGDRQYEFWVGAPPRGPVSAREAVGAHEAGKAVLGRWQVHRFTRLN